MDQFYYCNKCNETTNTTIIEKEQRLNVKGKEIVLQVPVRVCIACGEEIFDEELDSKTLDDFYKQYRKQEHLLMPEEIKTIRLKYNLSQCSFAKFLGFGEKTITRYENGAIQDACHDNLIRLIDSIDAFIVLWNERKECLTEKEQVYIDTIIKTYNKTKIQSTYCSIQSYCSKLPNIYLLNKGEISYAG